MREIKFRAWDKRAKKMTGDVFFKPESEDVILMQCTEIKDRNGKEIYEGDIVTKEYTSGLHTLEVKWRGYGGFSELYCSNKFEIIGNIYENPELV